MDNFIVIKKDENGKVYEVKIVGHDDLASHILGTVNHTEHRIISVVNIGA